MKRFIVIAVVAGVLAALFATAAFAAGPIAGRWAQGTTPSTEICPMGGTCAAGGTCAMGGPGMMGRMGAGGSPAWAGQPDAVASLLGLTAEKIQSERLAGKSLAQIAEGQGVPEQKLIDTILALKKDAMQQAVAAGKLTQAQADLMLDNMQSMVKTMVERTTIGPMRRQGMMGRQGMGMGGQGMRGRFGPNAGATGGTNF